MSERKTSEAVNVLYVEDEELNWRITERKLRDEFALTRASNASEVFSLLAKQPFDLILMDVQLSSSELDGISIARIIRGTYPGRPPAYASPPRHLAKIPIIFVTAYGSRYAKSALLEVGGSDVIYKPVNFAALTAAIGSLIRGEGRRRTLPPISE